MLRFSFLQVQNYAHSAGLYVAKFQGASSYRFRVYDEPNRQYIDEDYLFETISLAEIVAFVRGYRKALSKHIRLAKQTQPEPVQPALEAHTIKRRGRPIGSKNKRQAIAASVL